MRRHTYFTLILFAALVLYVPKAWAQDEQPSPTPDSATQDPGEPNIPLIHVVQEGETLFGIARLYETSVEVIQQLNDIVDPSILFVGQELRLPGGGGEFVAALHTVQFGDTLVDLSKSYNTTIEALAVENNLVSPYHLVAGQSLTVMSGTGTSEPQLLAGAAHVVRPGDTLLTIAAEHHLPPAEIAAANNLTYPAYLYPGQRLRLPGDGLYQSLPGYWQQIRMSPVPVVQGETVVLYVESQLPGLPTGQFVGQSLQFSEDGDGYLAFVGLDAFTDPGRYELVLDGGGERPWLPYNQAVDVAAGGYGIQYVTVPESLAPLLAPEIRAEEESLFATIFTQRSEQQWQGPFELPVSNTPISANYGDARSYNDGPIEIFHTGIDFAGPTGTPILSTAAGTVVFSDTLQLHGNTIIVDHGLGVMSAYYHLSKSHVSVGDQVDLGQIIAEGGSTGLSSGPHLHWDLRVNNVPVNGLQWTDEDLFIKLPSNRLPQPSTNGEP